MIRHGLSLGMERSDGDFYLTVKIIGKLIHEDYESLNPFVDAAIAGITEPHIRALIDMRELVGWEWHAAWDDLKFGLKHGKEFTKVAVLAHDKWMEKAAKVSSWFMPGEIKYFEDEREAVNWLHAD